MDSPLRASQMIRIMGGVYERAIHLATHHYTSIQAHFYVTNHRGATWRIILVGK